MQIYNKNIYEQADKPWKQKILIIYNISSNHYVGLPVHSKKVKDAIHIASIDKYVVAKDLQEYSKKNIKRTSIC